MNVRLTIVSIAALHSIAQTGQPSPAEPPRFSTTVYVGRHFEVRDHGQAVKYVFNSDTRVARVTGSLSANPRVQRLRLHTGWNLCAVAVNGAALPGNPEIVAAFRWNPSTQNYAPVGGGQTLDAGNVLWLKVSTNVVANIQGTYAEIAAGSVIAGDGYLAGAGLEGWPLQLPPDATAWRFDDAGKDWQPTYSATLASPNTLPPKLRPGEAFYIHAHDPVSIPAPDPNLRVAYYHPDHLSSSSIVTDGHGAIAEETAYYPFGSVRQERRFREIDTHYQFTQKERDPESGLHDFGNRYYHSHIAHWLSPDPLAERGGSLNPYAYVNQNPLKHYDPDGRQTTVTKTIDRKTKITTYNITLKAVLIDVSSKKFSQKDVAQYAQKLKSTIEKSFTGKQGKVVWNTKVDLRAVDKWSDVAKDDHVFRIVDRTKTGAAGNSTIGGMLMDIRAEAYTRLTPDQVDRTNPANKHYTWENFTSAEGTATHEFGHTAGLDHDNSRPNLMQEGSVRKFDNKDVHLDQIEAIWKASQANRLNQRDPVLNDLTKTK